MPKVKEPSGAIVRDGSLPEILDQLKKIRSDLLLIKRVLKSVSSCVSQRSIFDHPANSTLNGKPKVKKRSSKSRDDTPDSPSNEISSAHNL